MIMPRLKEATRPHHEAIEAGIDVFRLGSSIENYRRVLGRFLGYYEPVEDAFAGFRAGRRSAWTASSGERHRCWSPTSRAGARRRRDRRAAPLPGFPPIGRHGRSLRRDVRPRRRDPRGPVHPQERRARVRHRPGHRLAFYTSYGDRVGPMWKAFGEALTDFATTPETEDVVVRSAIGTFEAINAWFAAGAG